ncbi:hypothetical protein GCM10009128_08770 [Psychrosphaera haliotis]
MTPNKSPTHQVNAINRVLGKDKLFIKEIEVAFREAAITQDTGPTMSKNRITLVKLTALMGVSQNLINSCFDTIN